MESTSTITKRLQILEDAMILNHLSEIDFDSDDERSLAYQLLLKKTFEEGEFDDIFLSENLDGLDKSERQEIIDLARKYNRACFLQGDFYNWGDSVEGVTLGKPELISERLLSNYDYLIRLAKNGGVDVLKFLDKFQSSELFRNGAVIALLRNRFCDDDTLETILIEMANENGKYKDFTDTQKIIMCDSPDGVLYRKNDSNEVEIIPSEELKKSISQEFVGEDNYPMKDIDSKFFKDFIQSISAEYIGAVLKR